MPFRNSQVLTFRPAGCTDSVDGTNAEPGSMRRLANLVPTKGTKHVWQPRPARLYFALLADYFNAPSQVTGLLVVGKAVRQCAGSRRRCRSPASARVPL